MSERFQKIQKLGQMTQEKNINQWVAELREIAKEQLRKHGWSIKSINGYFNRVAFRDYYYDGYTAKDAFYEELSYWDE